MSLLLLSALLGCLSRPALVQAQRPMSVAVVAAIEPLDEARVQVMPEPVRAGLEKVLAERNLQPTALSAEQWEGAFTRGRSTPFRVAHAALAAQSDLVLVVEAFARYGSQLNGRYRWTVQVTATLAQASKPEQAVSSAFDVPVFLLYAHEREAEAVAAAAPVIERQVGHLLDQVLGGL